MDITQRIHEFAARETSLAKFDYDEFPLAGTVRQALAAPAPAGWRPTGLGRDAYLDVAERIVRDAQSWVDAQGRVVDPVVRKEVGHTTPRFAAPGAVLLHFGRLPECRGLVYRTMDACCRVLPTGQARQNSPDFWMRELATAYMALETVADPECLRRWAAGLAAVDPETVYTKVNPDGTNLATLGNWAIYASGGEAMRQAAGLRPPDEFLWGNAFFEKYVGAQLGCFTANGMYRDPGDPITYDITTRLQLACALAFGYDGPLRPALAELLRRGGLTTLLFMTPEGYCPYGGRSAAFHFREAIVSALCELEARRYRTTDARLAGAFKRQAHVSAQSVQRWLAMQPWRHIKNGFPPEARHGGDSYANYSCYGLLAASFFSLAAIFADDTIAEAPCPAETGGFAFELAPAFHKVLANCADTYVEIDTAADPHYDATGLGCFVVRGVPLELGLGMPFSKAMTKWGAPAVVMGPECQAPAQPVALGPLWQENGNWTSLAGLSDGLSHAFTVRRATPTVVEFVVTYAHGAVTVEEAYRLSRGRLGIRAQVRRDGVAVPRIGFTVPLLVSDGAVHSEIRGPTAGAVCVAYRGHTYTVQFPNVAVAEAREPVYANRNGVYRSLWLEHDGAALEIELCLE